MNCELAQQHILRLQTDELSSSEAKALALHLAACPDCVAYQEQAGVLLTTARESLPSGDPSPATMNTILDAARNQLQPAPLHKQDRRGLVIFLRPALPWLAYAALFLILVSGGYLYMTPTQPVPPTPTGISTMGAIVATLTEEEDGTSSSANTVDATDEQRTLARQLLRLEGFHVEESTVDEEALFFDDTIDGSQSLFRRPTTTTRA